MESSQSSVKVITRNETEIWLVGQLSSSLSLTKLPSKNEVMALFFHYKLTEKQKIRGASCSTAADVMNVWAKAGIPTCRKQHVIAKIEAMFQEWKNLKKNKENKVKRSLKLQQKEGHWKKRLKHLFDIAHSNALNLITIQEDKDFLLAQREKERRGKIMNVDKVLMNKQEKLEKRKEELAKRRKREEERKANYQELVILSSSSSESEAEKSPTNEESEEYFSARGGIDVNTTTSDATRPKRGRKNLIDDKLALSLDMAKLSNRNAALVLTPLIQRLNQDPSTFNNNTYSIRRERMKVRQKTAENVKRDFKPSVFSTIHWDGKMLEDITGKETVERLPIIVSGKGVDQLLGVPKLPSGTGEAAATAIQEALVAWSITDHVKCMGFDTTSVNTGKQKGTCTLLEQKLGKNMLWLACRHHILEIILEAVVLHSLGVSQGPDILIFKRFQRRWPSINQKDYQTVVCNEMYSNAFADIADETITFCMNQLLQYQPRDDYKEFLNLTIICLGGLPTTGVSFRTPAGLHRARWMAKVIYCLKIWMFRRQFVLTEVEETGIWNICNFVMRIYVKAWFTAPSAISAPRLDLHFAKQLVKYKEENVTISSVALKKLLGHLWYLSEELVALSFFDNEISSETKRKMIRNLDTVGKDQRLPRASVDAAVVCKKGLEDFVSSNTHRFFIITGLPCDFLKKEVDEWATDESYNFGRSVINSMTVTNDIAERGVSLIQEFNKLHTYDEEQKQYLLLAVKRHRQKYPDKKKSTLSQ